MIIVLFNSFPHGTLALFNIALRHHSKLPYVI